MVDAEPVVQSGFMADAKQIKNRVAAALRAGRRAKGLTQEALAAEVDCSVETLSNAERAISLPALELFLELARVLQVDLVSLIGMEADVSGLPKGRLRLVSDVNSLALLLDERSLKKWIAIGKVLKDD